MDGCTKYFEKKPTSLTHMDSTSTMIESNKLSDKEEQQDITINVNINKYNTGEPGLLNSLATHPKISNPSKIFVPTFIIINMLMFVYCNIAEGANISAGF